MSEAVRSYLSKHSGEALSILEALCCQASVAATGQGIPEMAGLTESLLDEAGFATRRLQIGGAPPIIYGEQRGRGPFTLLLYNHYDVQPAEPLDLWHSPPFAPALRDGKLYARGTSDNKGEIAARLAAVRALRAADGELPIGIRWIIEGEEEIGSPHFGQIIAPHAGLLRADGALWEGGGFDPDGRPEICVGFKGMLYVQLEVEVLQHDAHSGMAAILPSAAWRLLEALSVVRGMDGRVRIPGFYEAVRPPTPAQIAALEDRYDFEPLQREEYGVERFVDGLTGLPLRERASFGPTCNIAGLSSGYTGEGIKTVLPARAMAKMDFRLVPDQEPQAVLAALRAHLDAAGYADVRVEALGAASPVVTPLEEPFVQRMIEVATDFEGRRPSIRPIAGGTLPLLEALRSQVGVPGLAAPGNVAYEGSGAHAPNEHIRVADLERAVRFNCHMFAALGEVPTATA